MANVKTDEEFVKEQITRGFPRVKEKKLLRGVKYVIVREQITGRLMEISGRCKTPEAAWCSAAKRLLKEMK